MDRAALTRFISVVDRATKRYDRFFKYFRTGLIPCVKCGTFIGPLVLTRRRSSIVRVFYRSSFFFFFFSYHFPPKVNKLLLCKIYLSIVKLFGNVGTFIERYIKIVSKFSRFLITIRGKIKRGRKYALIISPRRETNMTCLTSEITRNHPFPEFESSDR